MLAPLPLPAALWASRTMTAPAAVGLSGFLVVLAIAQLSVVARDLYRSRRLGEALLRRHPGPPPLSGLASWRSDELTSDDGRWELVPLVRLVRRETEALMRTGSARVDRAVLDESLVLLRRLERRLDLLPKPISPTRLLGVTVLVAQFGPPNFRERDSLPAALAQALDTLEPE